MSSSTILVFISSIFLSFLMPNIIANTLIDKACSEPRLESKTKLCIDVLRSQPNIVSATNLYDLSIAIMQSGISSATNTLTYVDNFLKRPNVDPNLKGVLQECKSSYDKVIISFNRALREVRNDDEYDRATYHLLNGSTDCIQQCLDNVASGKIKDGNIKMWNILVPIYGLSAYQTVNNLPR